MHLTKDYQRLLCRHKKGSIVHYFVFVVKCEQQHWSFLTTFSCKVHVIVVKCEKRDLGLVQIATLVLNIFIIFITYIEIFTDKIKVL